MDGVREHESVWLRERERGGERERERERGSSSFKNNPNQQLPTIILGTPCITNSQSLVLKITTKLPRVTLYLLN